MTDEEKQEEFNRKADQVSKEGFNCCLFTAIISASVAALLLVPNVLLLR